MMMTYPLICLLAASVAVQSSDSGPASEIPKGFRFTEMEVSGIPRKVRIGHHFTIQVKNKGTVKQYIRVYLCVEKSIDDTTYWDNLPYDLFNPPDRKLVIGMGPGKVRRFRWTPSQKLVSRFHLASKNLKFMVENEMADSWGGPSFYSRTFQIVKPK